MRPIDPLLLQSFVCIADAQSFAKAARRLNKTQPAISTHINRLENLLGLSLMVRGSGRREVSLTPSGATLLPFARRILELQAETWKRLNNIEVRRKRQARRDGRPRSVGRSEAHRAVPSSSP
jgi:DNA-binding transcriptional LysR family regulator